MSLCDTQSLPGTGNSDANLPVGERPGLIRLFEFDHPLEGSSVYALDGFELCVIGRREARSVSLDGNTLRINIIDPLVSRNHACVRRSGARWTIEDADSKNGVQVNWTQTRFATLENNDLVQLGHTVFLFTNSLPETRGTDLEGSQVPCPLPGLGSLNRGFATLLESIAKIATTKLELLIHGETGTGKELVARAVHELSQRKGEFVAVNCGALPPNMIEGQLFGWRRGAFSGAVDDRPGLIRSAHGGTLFLDEIGDLPLAQQAALLRALQEGAVVPIGDSRPIEVDFRLVAATHRDLGRMVKEDLFREDLLARIGGFTAELPALRERRADLGMLIAVLLRKVVRETGVAPRFTAEAACKLITYEWPRNVRELDKCLASAVALAAGDSIGVDHLSSEVIASVTTRGEAKEFEAARENEAAIPEGLEVRRQDEVAVGEELEVQRQDGAAIPESQESLLAELLRQHNGNLAAVARGMATSRSQVHRLLRRFQMDPRRYRY